MIDHLSRALVWADSHGLTVPVLLGAVTVLARLVWSGLRPVVLRRWPRAVPVIEGAAVRVAAVLPDVLAALARRRPADGPSRRSEQSGHATVGMLVVLAAVGLVAPLACRRVREAAIDTQSPRVECVALSHRCHAGAPEVCSAAGRWWPSMPVSPSGEPRRCAVACEIVDEVARCTREVAQ